MTDRSPLKVPAHLPHGNQERMLMGTRSPVDKTDERANHEASCEGGYPMAEKSHSGDVSVPQEGKFNRPVSDAQELRAKAVKAAISHYRATGNFWLAYERGKSLFKGGLLVDYDRLIDAVVDALRAEEGGA